MVKVSSLCHHLSQRKLSNKRGPPFLQNRLQKKENVSNTVVEDKPADNKKEGEEPGVIKWDLECDQSKSIFLVVWIFVLIINCLATFSWRGVVIDTDQATEGMKDEENNEDSLPNQKAKPSKESGICCFIFQFMCGLWVNSSHSTLLKKWKTTVFWVWQSNLCKLTKWSRLFLNHFEDFDVIINWRLVWIVCSSN